MSNLNFGNFNNNAVDYYMEEDDQQTTPSIKTRNALEEVKEVQENFGSDNLHDKIRFMLKNQSIQLRSSKVEPLRTNDEGLTERKPNAKLLDDIITIFKKE
jgi:hypothetical protein